MLCCTIPNSLQDLPSRGAKGAERLKWLISHYYYFFFVFIFFGGLHMGLAFFYIGVLHIIQGKKRKERS